MNRSRLLLTAGISALGALSVIPSVSADPFLPVPPASFLNYHVSTARGLSEEVAQDVVVRARLARHFGMTGPQVSDYIRKNLVETTLTSAQSGQYRVACISPSGREYFVTEHLAAGTPVFALAGTGQPILKLECGNPLVASLPTVQAMTMPKKPVIAPVMASDPTAVPGQTVVASATLPADETFTAATPLEGYEFTGAGPIVNVEPFPATLLTHGGGLNFLPGLLAGAALFGLSGGHGGNSNVVVVPPPATPEPGEVMAFGCGVLTLAALGLRASRRRGSAA